MSDAVSAQGLATDRPAGDRTLGGSPRGSFGSPWARGSPATWLGEAVADALEHRRHIVLLPFAVMAGVLIYLGARFEPMAPPAIGLAAGLAILAITARWRQALTATRWLTLAAAGAAGFALAVGHSALFGTQMLSAPSAAIVSGVVIDQQPSAGDRQTVFVALTGSDAPQRLAGIRKIRLSVSGAPLILPGSAISVRARLFEVPGPVAPGGYDPQLHAYFAGIGAYATALDAPRVIPGSPGLVEAVAMVRALIAARIKAHLAEPAAAFAAALIIGEQGGITDEDRDSLARAGLAHVIAISGLHLSLVAGVAFLALRLLMAIGPLADRLPAKSIAALASIAVALGYLMISGAGTATIRATIMLGLVFAAVIAGRRALTMRNVTFAALIILAINPLEVMRPGFQLSFAAVVALIGCYESLRARADHQRRPAIVRYVGGLALTSLIAGIATAPFAAYHFQQFAPLGIVGNLLAVPIVALVVLPAALAGVLLIPFGLEALFFMAMGEGIEAILTIARLVSDMSGPLTFTPEMGPYALVAMAAGLAWFAFLRHPVRFLGPAAALIFLTGFGWLPPPDLVVSDTTQAVAIRSAEGLRLVGSNRSSFSVRAWSERFGVELGSLEAVGTCDRFGCVAQGADNWRVAIARTFQAAAEDCALVDVLVSRAGAPETCRMGTIVITPSDLTRRGVHVLTRHAGGQFDLRTSFDDIDRPWRAGRRD